MFENEARLAALPAWLNPFKSIDPSEIAFLNVAQTWAADQTFPDVAVANSFTAAPDGSIWAIGQLGTGLGWIGQNQFDIGVAMDGSIEDYYSYWKINSTGQGEVFFDNGSVISDGSGNFEAGTLHSDGNLTVGGQFIQGISSQPFIDLIDGYLVDQSGGALVQWLDCILNDQFAQLSANWNVRQVYNSSGELSADWDQQMLAMPRSTGSGWLLWTDPGSGNDSSPGFAAWSTTSNQVGGIFFGTGVPTVDNGYPGSVYVNGSSTGAPLTTFYQLRAGVWVGIL